MSLPLLEIARTVRADRQRERAKLRELANAVHYVFLAGGAPLNGTLDITDRVCVNAPGSKQRPNAKLIPQGRLVPLGSFFYPCPVLAHETTSRQIYESGVYEPDDEELQSTVDTHQPAAAQAAEIFEAYGNSVYGIGMIIVTSITGIEGISEYVEPLLFNEVARDLIHVIEMLELAPERIAKALREKAISGDLAEIAIRAADECLQAANRCKTFAERECERAVNEVESARAGHEGAKQLDPAARYWFRQLRVVPPRDEIFSRRVAQIAGAVPTPDPTLYKQCEFCAEDIKAQAKVCRWCNRPQGGFEVSAPISSQALVAMATIPQPLDESDPDHEPTPPGFGLLDDEDIPKPVVPEEPIIPERLSYGREIKETLPNRFDKKKDK